MRGSGSGANLGARLPPRIRHTRTRADALRVWSPPNSHRRTALDAWSRTTHQKIGPRQTWLGPASCWRRTTQLVRCKVIISSEAVPTG
jgi:hypothetical protein